MTKKSEAGRRYEQLMRSRGDKSTGLNTRIDRLKRVGPEGEKNIPYAVDTYFRDREEIREIQRENTPAETVQVGNRWREDDRGAYPYPPSLIQDSLDQHIDQLSRRGDDYHQVGDIRLTRNNYYRADLESDQGSQRNVWYSP